MMPKKFEEDINGEFGGIGAELEKVTTEWYWLDK
jgi:C-terminal processing protease CtpA/Prc